MSDWHREEEWIGPDAPPRRASLAGWSGRPATVIALLGAVALLALPALVGFSLPGQQAASGRAVEAAVPAQLAAGADSGFLGWYQDPEAGQTALEGPDLLDITAKLLLVLGLAWMAGHVMKRFLGGQSGPGGRDLIRLVEAKQLGPRRSLHLVEVADRTFLVGATDQQVTLLSQWTATGLDMGRGGSAGARPESPFAAFSRFLEASSAPDSLTIPSQPAYRARTCLARLRERMATLSEAAQGGAVR